MERGRISSAVDKKRPRTFKHAQLTKAGQRISAEKKRVICPCGLVLANLQGACHAGNHPTAKVPLEKASERQESRSGRHGTGRRKHARHMRPGSLTSTPRSSACASASAGSESFGPNCTETVGVQRMEGTGWLEGSK